MRAVRFHRYGDIDVLGVEDVEPRPLGPRDVQVRVRAAGINPGEAKIRTGALHAWLPAVFPSGQGSDLAGTVTATGAAVTGWMVGDPVLGWSWERSSHAEYVVVPEDQLVRKPDGLPWVAAGALYVAGSTAVASVAAVAPRAGETVVVSGATGGVGSLAVQLLRLRRANVVAVASARHQDWLESQGATRIGYGSGVAERLRRSIEGDAGGTAHAFLDFHGGDYPRIALSLGVPPGRINTLDHGAATALGTRSQGSAEGTGRTELAELAELAATGRIEVPISRTHPLAEVREAFAHLEHDHPLGKVVLLPDLGPAAAPSTGGDAPGSDTPRRP
ncbi:NADP-dependent oxidoreductase [Streptomyces tsukubensis]|uniref:NADPH:quinone reductase n=1 Tax=Streptomyces tsukubensis TaxID=83656 RepID=A0A1V4AGF4_9ACTN|nr:NADP-dependent oxidoreductase [Streptomyces tsukubensis]OON82523.1 NADPH:quinone reductase [Streptomyces tsukubensis]QFR92318.1 zinc-binding dehydrogenase [Streptomyces tsukubensis]